MTDKYFIVKNNLAQEKKHREKLGEAVWLYLYLLSYSNRSSKKDKTVFYIDTYCKRMTEDKKKVEEQILKLTNEGYIQSETIGDGQKLVTIIKPIKPMVCKFA
jgi:urease gamma subunit